MSGLTFAVVGVAAHLVDTLHRSPHGAVEDRLLVPRVARNDHLVDTLHKQAPVAVMRENKTDRLGKRDRYTTPFDQFLSDCNRNVAENKVGNARGRGFMTRVDNHPLVPFNHSPPSPHQ